MAALSDDIAYNNHDLHDGLRAELFSTDELAELPILGACFAEVDAKYPGLNYYRRRHEALRRFFGVLVQDVIGVTEANLRDLAPGSPEDVRHAGRMIVQFSPAVWADLRSSGLPLRADVPRALRCRDAGAGDAGGGRAVSVLPGHPEELPKQWRKDVAAAANETELARIVSDYIAGMTDRFALQCHDRLIGGNTVKIRR